MSKSAHAHDAHHEDFDPEPIQALSADEQPSPAWLPVVGGGLALVAAVWFFYPGGDAARKGPEPAPAAAPSPAAASPAATAAPAAKPRAPGGAKKTDLKALRAIKPPTTPPPGK